MGAVALVGTVFVLTSDDDEQTTGPTSTTVVGASTTTPGGSTSSVPAGTLNPSTLGPGEVLLEPVNVPTADPFTEPAGTTETPPTVSLPDIPLPTTTAPMGDGQVALPQVTGNNPGLYGGTRNAAECDQQAMIAFLEANPDKAAAWASVQGIAVADIRAYIEDLTPVVLTRDTRVTNHGFRNGQAFAHPSVLQRGHAVLVDRWGVPRAKCSCGNPLAPPIPMSQPPTYVGDRWPDFDVTIIIVVIAGDPVDEGFVLVDLTSGELIIRTVGATPDTPDLATGDIRVTLRWTDSADLDLAVTDPFGDTVSYGNPVVASGGTLDVDANSGCNSVMAAPAENIIWSGTPPDGVYVITIDDYSDCDSGESHQFELIVLVGGVPVQISDAGGALAGVGTVTGVVGSGAPTAQYSFAMGAGGPTGPTDPGDPGEFTDPATASATILDLLLLDCGVDGTFIDGGPVEGDGYRWIVSTPDGDASFVVYEPLGEWFVQPEDDLAAAIAVSCGFYMP
ncbi:MAG TPA: hypothetical protein DCR14_18300 [Acidimicrobiaceae bacterium]|nr:hypothetical protein [Acidimicrobiaceae bacterium]